MWQVRQRVLSNAEPELGLGLVKSLDVSKKLVSIYYSSVEEHRSYSTKHSPLSRYKFKVGQTIYDHSKNPHKIEAVQETNGVIKYITPGKNLWEDELSSTLELEHTGYDRFFHSKVFSHKAFDLRSAAWELKSQLAKVKTAGILGCRVKLLPHQIYVASKIASRKIPRALLADEVGLGKTIEAGLIFAALRATSRADKVLIIVPDSLVHQWTAEMYRRFGQLFSLLDESRCVAEESSLQASPFQSNSRSIVPISLLMEHPERIEQACAIAWDLVIVDEAHHLAWDLEEQSSKWLAIKDLSKATNGLLLLTGTPKQQGLTTQFGLLNLLDPVRFSNFDAYVAEIEQMEKVATCAKELQEQDKLSPQTQQILEDIFAQDHELLHLIHNEEKKDHSDIVSKLVDRHSTGHYVIRNKRKNIKGFPKRITYFPSLTPSEKYQSLLHQENTKNLTPKSSLDYASGGINNKLRAKENLRFLWFKDFVAKHSEEKILVICSSKKTVIALANYLATSDWHQVQRASSIVAVFHEDQSVIERDKQAAHFAKPAGPKILISSEIGGEGRNFQFVKKLVFMDIPTNPETLQQRIGRLDRIGQGKQIEIFLPYIESSPEEVLYKWYNEGLQAFDSPSDGGSLFIEELGEQVLDTIAYFFPNHPFHHKREQVLDNLLEDTRTLVAALDKEQERTSDVILDLNSFDETKAYSLLEEIDEEDDNPSLELFTRGFLDYYGVDYDEYDDYGSLILQSSPNVEEIPGFALDDAKTITFDRNLALKREDMEFLSYDHPLVHHMIAMLTERDEGILSFCKWENSFLGKGIFTQVLFIMECKSPKYLEVEKYFPMNHRNMIMNQHGIEIDYKKNQVPSDFEKLDYDHNLFNLHEIKTNIKPCLDHATSLMTQWTDGLKREALEKVKKEEQNELGRLRYLEKVNKNITAEDIKNKEAVFESIKDHINRASIRLDSLRIIFSS